MTRQTRFCVDQLTEHPAAAVKGAARRCGRRWCHMTCDDFSPAGLEALHCFAEGLGLRRSWFQDLRRGTNLWHPHYDLVPGKRALAVASGAVELDTRELLDWMARGRLAARSAAATRVLLPVHPDLMDSHELARAVEEHNRIAGQAEQRRRQQDQALLFGEGP